MNIEIDNPIIDGIGRIDNRGCNIQILGIALAGEQDTKKSKKLFHSCMWVFGCAGSETK